MNSNFEYYRIFYYVAKYGNLTKAAAALQMEAFSELHPKVTFRILNNSSRESVISLKQGQVDMAMISSIPFAMEDPLIVHTVHSYTDILIGGTKYSHLKGKTTSLPELCRYPWVSLMTGTITRNFLNTYFAERGLPFAPAIELATTDLILPAIEHNLGIGFLPPEFVRGALDMGSVFQIHFPDEMPHRRISLVYDTEYPQSIAATTFRKFMLEHFSQL